MQGNSHYHQGNQGQYTPPVQPPVPPKRKMPLWAKLVVGIVGIPMVVIGGCSAIVGGLTAAEVANTPAGTTKTYDPGIQTPPTQPAVPSPKITHKPAPKTAKPTVPGVTKSQQQAIGAAQDYLAFQAFSRKGLIQQLSSSYGEGFSKADATYAVDHITVDWNEQAAKAAKSYLQVSHFSRAGLIQQLESSAGEGFTHAQAVYGVTAAGL